MSIPTIANASGAGVVPTGQAIDTSEAQRPLMVVNTANFLRDNKILKMRTGLLNNTQEVDFFRYKRLVRAVTSEGYKSKLANPNKQILPVQLEDDTAKVLISLIQARMVIPVEKLHYKQIKEVKGWRPNREKPTLKPVQKAEVLPDAYYAWVYQKPNPYILLYALLAVAAVFSVILFPLWPPVMKRGVWYLSMGSLCFIGLFFVMAIIRLIIFIVTWATLPRAFWLYPNLFEDCGFFESFVPLYAWSEPKKKKSKKRVSAAAITTENGSAATKSTVKLEEVDE